MHGSLLFQWKVLCVFINVDHSPIPIIPQKTATAQRKDDIADEDDLEPKAWSGNRNRKLWKQTYMRAALSVKHLSSHPPPIPTHRVLAIPPRPRTSLRIHRTLITNHQHPQVRMSDVGRPPVRQHQRHLRRQSEQRVRLPCLEQFLGRQSKGGGERQRRRRGHAEYFYRRPRTGERVGNEGVSLSGEFKSHSHRRWV